jgi:hypothetical protein
MIVGAIATLLLGACVAGPTHRGSRRGPPPALPLIVELDIEPFYFQAGYYYHYRNNRWRYSTSRSGPWSALPRSHYPKETRFKGRDHGRDRDDDRGQRDRP